MKEWQKELYIYRLSPAPPRKADLQEYIVLHFAEKDEKYLSWFLHYYEPTLNTTVMSIVQRYAMFGHFLDIKEACVLGILRALEKYNPNSGPPFITYKTRIMWEEIIIGHSLNKVDMPYFEKVLNSVRENAVWKAYYFEDTDEKPFEKVLNDLGIKKENRFVRKTQELYL